MTESVPDETTLCKFRHLLEANGLNNALLRELRKQVAKLVQAVMDTIPAIAEGLESLRQKEREAMRQQQGQKPKKRDYER